MNVVGLSGGKDSSALALRLAEVEPDTPVEYIITPTGDELPEMEKHWAKLEKMLGQEIKRLPAPTLSELIERWDALPNFRQRWCTRVIKIEPCEVYLATLPPEAKLCIGLRHDEPTRAGGLYNNIEVRCPLREWKWGLPEVLEYLDARGVEIPRRTDCARCFYQRIGEWYELWARYPWIYEEAVQDEEIRKKTFRTPFKDSWPMRLAEIREAFQMGRKPPEVVKQKLAEGQSLLFEGMDRMGVEAYHECRICSL